MLVETESEQRREEEGEIVPDVAADEQLGKQNDIS